MRVAFALLGWGGSSQFGTVCILAEHGGLEHYRMSTVRHSTGSTHRPFGPPPTLNTLGSTVTTRPTPMTSLPNAEVMIGNSIAYPEATHNQFLPNNTFYPMLAMLPHWFFWCFGAGAYQSLPIVTTSPHAVIGELGALETRSTNHYQHLPTYWSGTDPGLVCLYHLWSPLGGITHSGLDYVLCDLIMY